MAKPCALLGGFGGMFPRENLFALIYARGSGAYATRENIKNMVQFGAFWCKF